jgi:capsular polysaccharide biosynthesis protein
VLMTLAQGLIPPIEVDPNLVTPGIAGFIATFVVGIGVIFLLLDMNRRMRRNRYRSEIAERLDREANPEGSGQ